jgi:hypothetical protein
MNDLRWPAWTALIAFVLTLLYIWSPGPYAMGAFTFIAQPLFLVAACGWGLRAWRDLRDRDVL